MCSAERVNARLKVLILYMRSNIVSLNQPQPLPPKLYSARNIIKEDNDISSLPCGSSVISSGAICPNRSLVACTDELKPFAILVADCPIFKLAKFDENLFQLSMICT